MCSCCVCYSLFVCQFLLSPHYNYYKMLEQVQKYQKLYSETKNLSTQKEVISAIKKNISEFRSTVQKDRSPQNEDILKRIVQINSKLQKDYEQKNKQKVNQIIKKTDQMLKKQKNSEILNEINNFQQKWKVLKEKFKVKTPTIIKEDSRQKTAIRFFFWFIKDSFYVSYLDTKKYLSNLKKGDYEKNLGSPGAVKVLLNVFNSLYLSYLQLQTEGGFIIKQPTRVYTRSNKQFRTQAIKYFKNLQQLKYRITYEVNQQDNADIQEIIDCDKVLLNIICNFNEKYQSSITPQFFIRIIQILVSKSLALTQKNGKYFYYFHKNTLFKNQINVYLEFYMSFILLGVAIMRQMIWTFLDGVQKQKKFQSFEAFQKYMTKIHQQKDNNKKSIAILQSQYLFCLQRTLVFEALQTFYFRQNENSSEDYYQLFLKKNVKQISNSKLLIKDQRADLKDNLNTQIAKHQVLSKVLLSMLSELQEQKRKFQWKKLRNKEDLYKKSFYLKKIKSLFQTYEVNREQISLFMLQKQQLSLFFDKQEKVKLQIYLEYHSRITTKFPSANKVLKFDQNIKLQNIPIQQIQKYINSYLFGEGITSLLAINPLGKLFLEQKKIVTDMNFKQPSLHRNFFQQFLYNKLSQQIKNIFQILGLQDQFKQLAFRKHKNKLQFQYIIQAFGLVLKQIPDEIRKNQQIMKIYFQDCMRILVFLWKNHISKFQIGDIRSLLNRPQFQSFQKSFIQQINDGYKKVLVKEEGQPVFQSKQTFKQQIPPPIKNNNNLYLDEFIKSALQKNSQKLQDIYKQIKHEEEQLKKIYTQNTKQKQRIQQLIQKGRKQKVILKNYLTQFQKEISQAQKIKYQSFLKKKDEEQLNNTKQFLQQILKVASQISRARRLDTNQEAKKDILQALLLQFLKRNPDQRLQNILFNFIKSLTNGLIDKNVIPNQDNYKNKSTTERWQMFDKINQAEFVKNLIGLIINILQDNSFFFKTLKQSKNIKQMIQQLNIQHFYLRNTIKTQQDKKFLGKIQDQIQYLQKRLKIFQKIQQKVKQDIKHFFQSINISGYMTQRSIEMLQKSAANNNEIFHTILSVLKNNNVKPKQPSSKQEIIQQYSLLKERINQKTKQMSQATSNLDRLSIIIDRQYDQSLQFLKQIENQKLRSEIQTKFRNNFIRRKQEQLHIKNSINKAQKLSEQIQCFLRGMISKKFFFEYILETVNNVQQGFNNVFIRFKHGPTADLALCAKLIFVDIQKMLVDAKVQGQESYQQCRKLISKQDIQQIIKSKLASNIKSTSLITQFWKNFKGYS